MYRMAFRAWCLLVLTALIQAPATRAYSQPSAPPQIEAVIRALQSGDQQALKGLLAPRLYRVVLAQKTRDPSLEALGEVESVSAQRTGADSKTGVATYQVDVVHRNGTSHWVVRIGANGRRVIVVAAEMNAHEIAAAAPSQGTRRKKKSARRPAMKNGDGASERIAVIVPNTTSAMPSGGNMPPVESPTAAAPPPPGPSMLPPGPAPTPADLPPMAGASPPPAARAGESPGTANPNAMRRIDPGAMRRLDGPMAGSGTPRPPAAPTDIPVFPGTGAPASAPAPADVTATRPPEGPAAPTTTPAAPSEPRVVDFLFATSRARDTAVATVAFSGQRSRALTYGQASVRIPDEHRIGEVTIPSVWKIWGITLSEERLDERKHFSVRALKTLTHDEWDEVIKARNPKTALIFVHGFNTSFEDALYRNAQIVWDLRYDGLSVLYSWASWGGTFEYLYDRESAQIGRAGFIEVLRDLKEKHGIETVNVIAHSMGNQVVLDALGSHARTTNPATIGELILAAPDVDRDMFVSLIPDVHKIVKGITLYASSADKALAASRRLAGELRAGDIGPDGPIVLENMQTIDVTAIGEEFLGLNHNVFAASRDVIDDISLLLTKGLRPPDQRLRQIRPFPEPPEAPRYWRYAQ